MLALYSKGDSLSLSFHFLPQSFDRTFEDHDLQREIERRMSGSFVSSGLFSLNMSETEKAVDVTIDPAASYGCESFHIFFVHVHHTKLAV